MRRRRVQLGQQEPSLTSALVTHNIPRNREAVDKKVLCVLNRQLEQLLEVLVSLLVLISEFPPLSDLLAVEDEDVEEGVQKEDDVWLDGYAVQEHGLGRGIKGIGHEGRLNHDQRVVDVFFVKDMARREKCIRN